MKINRSKYNVGHIYHNISYSCYAYFQYSKIRFESTRISKHFQENTGRTCTEQCSINILVNKYFCHLNKL